MVRGPSLNSASHPFWQFFKVQEQPVTGWWALGTITPSNQRMISWLFGLAMWNFGDIFHGQTPLNLRDSRIQTEANQRNRYWFSVESQDEHVKHWRAARLFLWIAILVGGWATPLKKIRVRQLGWWKQPHISGTIKFMFQTTNQLLIPPFSEIFSIHILSFLFPRAEPISVEHSWALFTDGDNPW